jgi:LmbE family N-acetylglucosaminyl deacetylase
VAAGYTTAKISEILERVTATQNDPALKSKTALVFAHVDDEVIALGSRLKSFDGAYLVHVTDSAPRNECDSQAHGFSSWQEYRQARVQELEQALRIAGLRRIKRNCLEIPDQEASRHLPELVWQLFHIFAKQQPEVVLTHPYEGGHPDHDACAFAVHHAVGLLNQEGRQAPIIIEGAFYHIGSQGIETGSFLPHPQKTEVVAYPLSASEGLLKQRLLECFKTQQDTLRYFTTDCERFRIAPAYNFLRPPHGGPVFYDRFPWGMTSNRFCELANEAEVGLQAQECACH